MSISNEKEQSSTVLGFVLMTDANMDWPRFRRNLREDWGIIPDSDVNDNILLFQQGNMKVACSLIPSPVPENEAEECAKNNFLWKNAAEETAKHRAHVMIAVMNKEDPIEQSLLFAKVASSMLKLKNTIGIYKEPTVYEKGFYTEFAHTMKKGELPVPVLIHVGMYMTKDALLCGYTSGLRYFGKEEIEVVDTKAQPGQLYTFMLSIAEYALVSDSPLKDGDIVGFSEDEKLSVTLSDGVSVEGQTLKIDFMT